MGTLTWQWGGGHRPETGKKRVIDRQTETETSLKTEHLLNPQRGFCLPVFVVSVLLIACAYVYMSTYVCTYKHMQLKAQLTTNTHTQLLLVCFVCLTS